MSTQTVTALCGIGNAIQWDRLCNLQAIIAAANKGQLGVPMTEWLSGYGWEPAYREVELSAPPKGFDAYRLLHTNPVEGPSFFEKDEHFREQFFFGEYLYDLPEVNTAVRSTIKRDGVWEKYEDILERIGGVNAVCNIFQLYQLLCCFTHLEGEGFKKGEHGLIYLIEPRQLRLCAISVVWRRNANRSCNGWGWYLSSTFVSPSSLMAGTAIAGTRIFYNHPVSA